MENKIDIIINEFIKLNSRLDNIENKINDILLSSQSVNIHKSSNFEIIKFDDYSKFNKISKNFVCVDTELDIFKIIYKEDIPIKLEGVRKYYYRYNNEWIPDTSAYHITSTLFTIFENILMKINTLERVNNNYDTYLSNQEHISKLRNKSYRKSIIRKIQELL